MLGSSGASLTSEKRGPIMLRCELPYTQKRVSQLSSEGATVSSAKIYVASHASTLHPDASDVNFAS